jgi:hypothetical protein
MELVSLFPCNVKVKFCMHFSFASYVTDVLEITRLFYLMIPCITTWSIRIVQTTKFVPAAL